MSGPFYSSKAMSPKDAAQVLRSAYSDSDCTLQTSGFLDGKVGHRILTTSLSATVDLNTYLDELIVDTCTLNSTTTVVVPNTINLSVGMTVLLDVGTAGVPAGTTIATIVDNTHVTLSQAATVSGSFSVHFANIVKKIQIAYSDSTHATLVDAARVL